ncbi:MAG: SPOR domain-containing protein, partial [Candidatus Aminicenantaceae bacterium]
KISIVCLVVLFLFVFLIYGYETDLTEKLVPRIEKKLIEEIKKQGPENRFMIKEFNPQAKIPPSRVTIKQHSTDSISAKTEFPDDTVANYDKSNKSIWGKESIHRFEGRVELKVEAPDGTYKTYTFIGEGSKLNRLTFLLTEQGYVYMRGKGKVVLPNGTQIFLPKDYESGELEESTPGIKEEDISLPEKEKSGEVEEAPTAVEKMVGFRVQIAALYRREDANKLAEDIRSLIKDENVYVEHINEYWKVRIGDFRTKEEAKKLKERLKTLGYKAAWIVSCQIELR